MKAIPVLSRWKRLSPVIHPSSALNLYHYIKVNRAASPGAKWVCSSLELKRNKAAPSWVKQDLGLLFITMNRDCYPMYKHDDGCLSVIRKISINTLMGPISLTKESIGLPSLSCAYYMHHAFY